MATVGFKGLRHIYRPMFRMREDVYTLHSLVGRCWQVLDINGYK